MILFFLNSRTVCVELKLIIPWKIELLFKVNWRKKNKVNWICCFVRRFLNSDSVYIKCCRTSRFLNSSWGTWVAQAAKHRTLDCGSGHGPKAHGPSPSQAPMLSREPAWNSLPPSALRLPRYIHTYIHTFFLSSCFPAIFPFHIFSDLMKHQVTKLFIFMSFILDKPWQINCISLF